MLYLLILTDLELSYDEYSEDFLIGFFFTEKQAEETARYYLQNVQGFCEYDCTYRIVKKVVAGNPNQITPEWIWIVQGWNTNEYFDETDITESDCFVSHKHAKSVLHRMQHTFQRTEWALNHHKIGDLNWREGFVRV
ncbi:MAG: hypothetical protein K2L86_02285 [Lachnospiraceae bacterium]|nr:hypothetical protein [Lachnospiraceae bacterium]